MDSISSTYFGSPICQVRVLTQEEDVVQNMQAEIKRLQEQNGELNSRVEVLTRQVASLLVEHQAKAKMEKNAQLTQKQVEFLQMIHPWSMNDKVENIVKKANLEEIEWFIQTVNHLKEFQSIRSFKLHYLIDSRLCNLPVEPFKGKRALAEQDFFMPKSRYFDSAFTVLLKGSHL